MISFMSTAMDGSEWVGRVVDGRFPLQRRIGGTERSCVFLTECEGEPGRKAAIKLIPAEGESAEARMATWTATEALTHPHLMRLYAGGRCRIDDADLLYAVTDYAEEVLAEILPDRPLTPEETREMLGPVLDALGYLHEKGFVHGRLKPSNILVVEDQLKLSVDGLRRASDAGRLCAAPGIHDAPEYASRQISPAADVWSLGITLVEALTQHPPEWDRSREAEPSAPQALPQPFAGIARECLRTDPALRCTLSRIKARLETAQTAPLATEAAASPQSVSEAAPSESNRRGKMVISAVVVFLLLAIASWQIREHLARSSQPAQSEIAQPVEAPAAQPVQPETAQPAKATRAKPVASKPAASKSVAPAPPAPAPQAPAVATRVPRGPAEKGEVTQRVMPEVLPKATATIQGRVNVNVRVEVGADGNVSDASFEKEGPSRYFAKAALDAARGWKFDPAQVDGQPVPSTWILRFKFERSGTTVNPVETAP